MLAEWHDIVKIPDDMARRHRLIEPSGMEFLCHTRRCWSWQIARPVQASGVKTYTRGCASHKMLCRYVCLHCRLSYLVIYCREVWKVVGRTSWLKGELISLELVGLRLGKRIFLSANLHFPFTYCCLTMSAAPPPSIYIFNLSHLLTRPSTVV